MNISENKFGNSTFITIKNNVGLEIELCTMGASIYFIKHDDKLITYAPSDKKEFLHSSGYYGKTVGRIAGRVKDGIIEIHNKKYQLNINEKGKNTLHSGNASFSDKDFTYEIKEDDKAIKIIFHYFSPHMEGGFPGDANVEISYYIYKNENVFDIIHHVDVSEDTIIALTNHAYYSLANAGEDVLDHYLTIPADKYYHINDLLLLEKEVDVNEIFDFRVAKKIGDGEYKAQEMYKGANGYDHTFIINNNGKTKPIVFENDILKLQIYTSYPAVNCYGNCYPNNLEMLGHGKDFLYAAFAIEPQKALLRHDDLIVTKDKPYHYESRYIIERK